MVVAVEVDEFFFLFRSKQETTQLSIKGRALQLKWMACSMREIAVKTGDHIP